jgi:hypothetical protein
MKCDLTEVAREIIDIVTGKSPRKSSTTGISDAGASSKLLTSKGNLNAKRTQSLLVQIEAAGGVRQKIARNVRKRTNHPASASEFSNFEYLK